VKEQKKVKKKPSVKASSAAAQQNFSWDRVGNLIGLPYHDPLVQKLFSDAKLDPESLWREVRVGIYSMPPHDQQPSPIAEIDLVASHQIRFRFKHASLVVGAKAKSPTAFVMASVTYFLDSPKPKERFAAGLPFGILSTDNLEAIIKHVGRPPTEQEIDEKDGYVAWKEQSPVIHVLYSVKEKRPLRTNIFLSASVAE
jgi:hypothetical protein